MYYYLYDSELADKKYHKQLAKIEKRLTDLGINGRVHHLSFLKNIGQLLAEEIKRGISAIVVVGDDKTVGQIINLLPDHSTPVGIIPINTGGTNQIAKSLGIISGEEACNILSARIVQSINIGLINQYKFITSLSIDHQPCVIECDHNYFISIDDTHHVIKIVNLKNTPDNFIDITIHHNQSGWLFKKSDTTTSHIKAKKITITSNQSASIKIDDENKIIKTPATITILPGHLNIIVGKNRLIT